MYINFLAYLFTYLFTYSKEDCIIMPSVHVVVRDIHYLVIVVRHVQLLLTNQSQLNIIVVVIILFTNKSIIVRFLYEYIK